MVRCSCAARFARSSSLSRSVVSLIFRAWACDAVGRRCQLVTQPRGSATVCSALFPLVFGPRQSSPPCANSHLVLAAGAHHQPASTASMTEPKNARYMQQNHEDCQDRRRKFDLLHRSDPLALEVFTTGKEPRVVLRTTRRWGCCRPGGPLPQALHRSKSVHCVQRIPVPTSISSPHELHVVAKPGACITGYLPRMRWQHARLETVMHLSRLMFCSNRCR